MGFIIEDGRGSGRKATVDENGLLGVRAISQSIEHSINHNQSEAGYDPKYKICKF